MSRGLFVGRFQPPHLGHIYAIKTALSQSDELIIVIGSAQYSYTFDNPFTAGERIEMLKLALIEEGVDISRIFLIPIPDVGEHSLWVSRVKSFCPRFDVVYTNNPLVKRLFEDEGYPVKQIEPYRRGLEMGTRIRKMMLEGGAWEELVPKSVAEFIHRIKGIERLKEVCSKD